MDNVDLSCFTSLLAHLAAFARQQDSVHHGTLDHRLTPSRFVSTIPLVGNDLLTETRGLGLPHLYQASDAGSIQPCTLIPSTILADPAHNNGHDQGSSSLNTSQNDIAISSTNVGTHPNTVPPPSTTPTANPPVVNNCGITSAQACTLPLAGTMKSIRFHLRLHGHKHREHSVVYCPWVGCSDTLMWMNVPRHIRSRHLGVKFECTKCSRQFTREYALTKHVASNQCMEANENE